MKIEIINCKWDGGNGALGLSVISAFIKTHKTEEPKRSSVKLSKKHNYQFKVNHR